MHLSTCLPPEWDVASASSQKLDKAWFFGHVPLSSFKRLIKL